MKSVKDIKRIQVDGKKYLIPTEDANIEKLIQKGMKFKKQIDDLQGELESIQSKLIDIARSRREKTTTITLPGVTVKAIITFRESLSVSKDIEDIAVPLGGLFERFFSKSVTYKATSELKKFMESGHALGIKNSDEVKTAIRKHVTMKETKPNVKMDIL